MGYIHAVEELLELADVVQVMAESPDVWQIAAKRIKQGGLVVFPTDTVYGIGCAADDAVAIERVYDAKSRPLQKALPLLLSDSSMVLNVARDLSRSALVLSQRFWPGALTLVVRRHRDLPEQLGSGDTIAVRVPAHDGLREFIALCGGAIAGTSANRSGDPDAIEVSQAVAYFGLHVALYVDGGRTAGSVPSTVVDCAVDPPRIVREGRISAAAIAEAVRALGN
ncbi:MAG: L-threonylcarbamoyladenylate synthase [Chloroflexota bacterium]